MDSPTQDVYDFFHSLVKANIDDDRTSLMALYDIPESYEKEVVLVLWEKLGKPQSVGDITSSYGLAISSVPGNKAWSAYQGSRNFEAPSFHRTTPFAREAWDDLDEDSVNSRLHGLLNVSIIPWWANLLYGSCCPGTIIILHYGVYRGLNVTPGSSIPDSQVSHTVYFQCFVADVVSGVGMHTSKVSTAAKDNVWSMLKIFTDTANLTDEFYKHMYSTFFTKDTVTDASQTLADWESICNARILASLDPVAISLVDEEILAWIRICGEIETEFPGKVDEILSDEYDMVQSSSKITYRVRRMRTFHTLQRTFSKSISFTAMVKAFKVSAITMIKACSSEDPKRGYGADQNTNWFTLCGYFVWTVLVRGPKCKLFNEPFVIGLAWSVFKLSFGKRDHSRSMILALPEALGEGPNYDVRLSDYRATDILGNVECQSWAANRFESNATTEEFKRSTADLEKHSYPMGTDLSEIVIETEDPVEEILSDYRQKAAARLAAMEA